ncbi:MAG: DUF721 domain-containing protein [Hyphomonadaceae bacterium]|nr:DUF721 domain-containing protein [Hyphomonadaceae bacterium]
MKPPRKSESSKSGTDRVNRGKIISYLEKNRGKPQYRPTPSAAMAVNRVIRPLSKKFGPGASALASHWPQIVGEKWAKLSRPRGVRGAKGEKTLMIEAQGPAATLLQANSKQLLDKINQFLGDGAITKLRIQQGKILNDESTLLQQKAESNVQSPLGDEGENALHTALNKLGQKIAERQS